MFAIAIRAASAAVMLIVLASGFADAADIQVKIDNFTFNPQRVTVKVGDTVTWLNEDDIPHTVRATAGDFKSKALDTGDRYAFTFTKAGSYDYFCSLHPHMTGHIVVESVGGASATP
jgi:amicyanin